MLVCLLFFKIRLGEKFESLDIGLEENNGIISNITVADNIGVKNYEDQNGYPVIEIVDLSKNKK
jgi:hypothetical protein